MLCRNYRTKISWFTWLSVMVTVGFGFEFKCPEPSQRKFRKHTCDKQQLFMYSCLYDKDKEIYDESCSEDVDFVKAGKRYVHRGGRDSDDCIDSRYQPRKFWSNVTSNCEMLKSTCCEPGQIVVSNGSTTEDRACRCDILNGFAFITTRIDVCSCIPSQEDCSCYRTNLTEGKILAEAFNCVNSTVPRKCSSVGELEIKLHESTISTGNSTTVYTLDNKGYQREKIHRYRHIVHIYIVLFGCIVLTFACAVVILAFGLDEKLDFKIMVLRDGEVNRARKEKDSFKIKVITNWKDLKRRMDCTDVENQLSKYTFMDARSLRKQKLWKKYPKDCLLKFIAERSFEIVDHIRWYNVREDILFQIIQLPLVEPTNTVIHPTDTLDQQNQELYLHSNQLKLLKYIQIESDDIIIDDFIERFVFELTDMEEIREQFTSSEMDKRFLEIVIKRLQKGSYRIWLDIENENRTRSPQILNILRKLAYDQLDQAPNIEVKLMKSKLHNGNTDKVREVLLDIKLADSVTKQMMHVQKQTLISCASSFMEVLGSFPVDDTRPGIYLAVICSKLLERTEKNIVRGTFHNLVKELCIKHNIGVGSYVYDITLKVAKEDEHAVYNDSDEQPSNIIQSIRSFLVEEMDTEIIASSLCHEMNEEYTTKLNEHHNRIQKAEIICDYLQENCEKILPNFLRILKQKKDMEVVMHRLQSYQTIKDTDHLRNVMTRHFRRIVSSVYSKCLLSDIIYILKKQNIFNGDFEKLTTEPSEILIAKYLVHVMKKGRTAMLHFIDALHAVGEKDLSEALWLTVGDICTEEDAEIVDSLQKEQLLESMLFWAQFQVTWHNDEDNDNMTCI